MKHRVDSEIEHAAWHNEVKVIEKYLENGGNPNGETRIGTLLHIAAAGGNYEVAKLLIEYDADVNAKCRTGRSPLHDAALFGHLNIVKLLIENGADPLAKINNVRRTEPIYSARFGKRYDVVDFLEQFGAAEPEEQ